MLLSELVFMLSGVVFKISGAPSKWILWGVKTCITDLEKYRLQLIEERSNSPSELTYAAKCYISYMLEIVEVLEYEVAKYPTLKISVRRNNM
jgi:hypothetical protein